MSDSSDDNNLAERAPLHTAEGLSIFVLLKLPRHAGKDEVEAALKKTLLFLHPNKIPKGMDKNSAEYKTLSQRGLTVMEWLEVVRSPHWKRFVERLVHRNV
jgi:hypothetical protein